MNARRLVLRGIGVVGCALATLAITQAAGALLPGYSETKLVPAAPSASIGFGRSIAAADNGTLVVGTDDDVALVYRPNQLGGYLETVLEAPPDSSDFGTAVAMSASGDTIAVADPRNDDQGSFAGAVYAFQDDGNGDFTRTKLIPAEAETFSGVGDSVAVAGDTILVGAVRLGGVFLFEPDGGGSYTETKLTPSEFPADFFGSSIAASGDLIVVGAFRALDDGDVPTGAVYLYRPDGAGGYTETRILASDGEDGDEFGFAVDTDGSSIIVGATGHNGTTGKTYLYQPDGAGGYTETSFVAPDGDFRTPAAYYSIADDNGGYTEGVFSPGDGNPGEDYGRAVEVTGDTLIVGAPDADGRGVYVYRTDDPGPEQGAIAGRVADLSSDGVSGVAIDLFDTNRQFWLASTTTAIDGTFRFDADPGCYVVTHIAPAGTNFTVGPYKNTRLCVSAGITTGGIDATLLTGAGSAAISPLAMNEDGTPVEDLLVDLFLSNEAGQRGAWLESAPTGSDGRHTFEPLAAGCYVVTFLAPDGRTFVDSGVGWFNVPVCVESGEQVSDLEATLAGAAPPDGTIEGTVTDANGPLTLSVTVDLFTAFGDGSRGTFLTDTRTDRVTGAYTLVTRPGCYVVTFVAPAGRTFVETATPWKETAVCVEAGESTTGIDATMS